MSRLFEHFSFWRISAFLVRSVTLSQLTPLLLYFHLEASSGSRPPGVAKIKKNMTCESKPNHQHVIQISIKCVFENKMEVFRSWECHHHLQIDLLYLLHLSDPKKAHYKSSYGHFIEKMPGAEILLFGDLTVRSGNLTFRRPYFSEPNVARSTLWAMHYHAALAFHSSWRTPRWTSLLLFPINIHQGNATLINRRIWCS